MQKIVDNYSFYRDRKIKKYIKYSSNNNHLSKEKKEKLYEYYKCDYCEEEIKIQEKKNYEKSTGGIVEIPYTLTGKAPITLTLCTKCLKPVLAEFEKARNGENHIPRID